MDTELYAATAEFYDYVVPYQTREDVAFFVEAAQASGRPVLEVGCGTGRVLIPTARAGSAKTQHFEVWGSFYPTLRSVGLFHHIQILRCPQ